MTAIDLHSQLQHVTDEKIATRKIHDQQMGELLAQRQTTQQELLAFQRRLDELTVQERKLKLLEDQQAQAFAERQFTLVVDALVQHRQQLVDSLEKAVRHQKLIDRRADLVQRSPNLELKLKDYRWFEANKEKMLASMSGIYAENLLTTHQVLAAHLQPLLALDQELQQTQVVDPTTLLCPIYVNQDSSEIILILPIVANELNSAEPSSLLFQQLLRSIHHAVFDMSKTEHWLIAAMEENRWTDFATINLLAEYKGSESIVTGFQLTLSDCLAAQTDSLPVPIIVEIVSIDDSVCAFGLARTTADESVFDEEDDEQISAIEDHDEDGILDDLTLDTGGWYSSEDIRSWQRTLKVAADSKWTRPARQVRTLLIRLIGKGIVGNRQVPQEQLWHALPKTLTPSMQENVQRLRESDLLISTEDAPDAATLVSINPALLEEVQNLINRTITSFWQEVVGDEVAVQA